MSKKEYAWFNKSKPKEQGFSQELISSNFKDYEKETDTENLECWQDPTLDTLYKGLQKSLRLFPDHPFLGTLVGDQYQWKSVRQCVNICKHFASGCQYLGLIPEVPGEGKQWRFLGIQSKNREEWALCHFGNMWNGTTSVALYDTLGLDAFRYICNQTELVTICCSIDVVKKIIAMKKEDDASPEKKLFRLKNIVSFGEAGSAEIQQAKGAGLEIMTFDDVVRKGSVNFAQFNFVEPKTDDVFMLCYTSGTTGDPKGVKLTQRAICMACQNTNQAFANDITPVNKDDVYFSYLPLAHVAEQNFLGVSALYGMSYGFYSGDILKMMNDIVLLKPTIFLAVPRIYNRIYDKIIAGMEKASGCKGWLAKTALAGKLDQLRQTGSFSHPCYDCLVFNKIKNLLGGNVRIMITGSAPIAKEVLDVMKVCFCCEMYQGYGLTETCGGCTCTRANDPTASAHCGGSTANIKLRLRDIPDMGYSSLNNPPTGEVCVKGHQVTKGYYKNPEKTAEAFHDGWFLTGDVGQIQADGSLKIIDRAKNIFKLSQGEYIAPEKLENVYVQSEWVLQPWIYGDSHQGFCVFFAVVDPARLKQYQNEEGSEETQGLLGDDLNKDARLKSIIYEDIVKLAQKNKFNSLEIPKNMTLLKEQFTVENDLLTPSQKLKRNVAKKTFNDHIERMYKEGMNKFPRK